jgi:outer membrane protein assembly factor BamB
VPPQSKNIRWSAPLGGYTYGSPVVHGGRVFIGTNNTHGYLQRYPVWLDCGCLLCFDDCDGTLLWQATSPKLSVGREQDYPMYGVTGSPVVAGDRCWYVNNRAEVVCLDVEGFHDGENDGPVIDEPPDDEREADVVWRFDMRATFDVHPHEISPCRPATDGKRLFVVTGNGVDLSHALIPNPNAPSFVALDRQTGKVLWTDNSPGGNVMHHQWGSPTFAVISGVPQVIFPGGDGWLYSFDPAGTPQGLSKLLWKFDLNPKTTVHDYGGRGTRNETAFVVTISGNRVFAIAGEDPEHGEGPSVLWCIDATKRGDLSAELAVNSAAPTIPLPPQKPAAINPDRGELAVPNPNSGVIWKFEFVDTNQNGQRDWGEWINRTRGGVAVKEDVALVADTSGLVHCFDANTGQRKWFYDCQANCIALPLIAGRHAYVADEDGDVAIFEIFPQRPGQQLRTKPITEIQMPNSIYGSPTAAKGVLYIPTMNDLFAIESQN